MEQSKLSKYRDELEEASSRDWLPENLDDHAVSRRIQEGTPRIEVARELLATSTVQDGAKNLGMDAETYAVGSVMEAHAALHTPHSCPPEETQTDAERWKEYSYKVLGITESNLLRVVDENPRLHRPRISPGTASRPNEKDVDVDVDVDV